MAELRKPCVHPGCMALVKGGGSRCSKHAQQDQREYDQQRGSAAKRGYGRRWQRYRASFLAEHPICSRCGDVAEAVDHIQPVTGPDDPLFWEPTNHQGLCQSCHSSKTASEDGGYGK